MADMRRCIGSARFGIEPHDASIDDFPKQPSQKDGLGRMCKTHWNLYTKGLAREAKARKAAEGTVEGDVLAIEEAAVNKPAEKRGRRRAVPASAGPDGAAT